MTRSDRVATLEEAKAQFQKSWVLALAIMFPELPPGTAARRSDPPARFDLLGRVSRLISYGRVDVG
jgi:hypothetical protein